MKHILILLAGAAAACPPSPAPTPPEPDVVVVDAMPPPSDAGPERACAAMADAGCAEGYRAHCADVLRNAGELHVDFHVDCLANCNTKACVRSCSPQIKCE